MDFPLEQRVRVRVSCREQVLRSYVARSHTKDATLAVVVGELVDSLRPRGREQRVHTKRDSKGEDTAPGEGVRFLRFGNAGDRQFGPKRSILLGGDAFCRLGNKADALD